MYKHERLGLVVRAPSRLDFTEFRGRTEPPSTGRGPPPPPSTTDGLARGGIALGGQFLSLHRPASLSLVTVARSLAGGGRKRRPQRGWGRTPPLGTRRVRDRQGRAGHRPGRGGHGRKRAPAERAAPPPALPARALDGAPSRPHTPARGARANRRSDQPRLPAAGHSARRARSAGLSRDHQAAGTSRPALRGRRKRGVSGVSLRAARRPPAAERPFHLTSLVRSCAFPFLRPRKVPLSPPRAAPWGQRRRSDTGRASGG